MPWRTSWPSSRPLARPDPGLIGGLDAAAGFPVRGRPLLASSLRTRPANPLESPVAQVHDSMMNPKIEDLLSKVDSKFTLVSLGSLWVR